MADFHDVHHARIEAAMAKWAPRKGDYFCIPMLEPIDLQAKPAMLRASGALVMVVDAAGVAQPKDDRDRSRIQQWNERHRNTPAEAFAIPDPWGDRFAPPPEEMP